MNTEVIIGPHSIYHALKKRPGSLVQFFYSSKAQSTVQSWAQDFDSQFFRRPEIRCLKDTEFSSAAEKIYKEHDRSYYRPPGSMICVFQKLPIYNLNELWTYLEKRGPEAQCTVVALDQISDTQNAAAILRTSAFFEIDFIIFGQKSDLGLSPGFFRTSSGAAEYIPIVRVNSMATTVRKLQERKMSVVGLAEEGRPADSLKSALDSPQRCFLFGSEDLGLSHAVRLALGESMLKLGDKKTDISSLNVSVSVAVTLERFLKNPCLNESGRL